MLRFIFGTLFLLASVSFPKHLQAKGNCPSGAYQYKVKQGDSCWSLARRVYGDPRKYGLIYRLNGVSRSQKKPFILRPGQLICLPGKKRSPEAKIEWVRREVRAKPPRSLDWFQARKNTELWRRYKVATGPSSSTMLLFSDRSNLYMRERALMIIFGPSAISHRLKKSKKHRVVIERGVVRGGLSSLDKAAGLNIETPSSKVEITGSGKLQVEVDQKKTSIVSVYKGKAKVKAQGQSVKVPANFGTFVKKGKRPAKPRRLPNAPKWGKQESGFFALAKSKGTPLSLSWSSVGEKLRYRLEIARDRKFKKLFYFRPSLKSTKHKPYYRCGEQNGTAVNCPLLFPVGSYFVRVSAKDKYKLEGRFSKLYKMKVLPLALMQPEGVTPSCKQIRVGSNPPVCTKLVYNVTGLLKLSPPKSSKKYEYSLNGKNNFQAFKTPLRYSKPGVYTFHFRELGSSNKPSKVVIEVLRIDVVFSIPHKMIKVKGRDLKISVQLRDKTNKVKLLPGFTVHAYPGGKLPLKLQPNGSYKTFIPAPKSYTGKRVLLRASWSGGDLGEAGIAIVKPQVVVHKPRSLPLKPEFHWPDVPSGVEWGHRGPGLPSRAAQPVSFFGLSSFLAEYPSSKTSSLYLRMSLRAELSLLKGNLGFDLDLPWFQLDVLSDSRHRSKLGDIRLGVRSVAHRSESFLLTPSLRVALPTAGYRAVRQGNTLTRSRCTDFEPGLLLQWNFSDILIFTSNQIFVLHSDFGKIFELFHASSYGLVLRFGHVTIATEFHLGLGLAGRSPSLTAMALHSALRFHFGQSRISLQAGVPLGVNSFKSLGSYSVGLAFDLGFTGF